MSSNGVEQGEEVKIVEPLKENGYPSSFVHRESGPGRPTQETITYQRPPGTTLTLLYNSAWCLSHNQKILV